MRSGTMLVAEGVSGWGLDTCFLGRLARHGEALRHTTADAQLESFAFVAASWRTGAAVKQHSSSRAGSWCTPDHPKANESNGPGGFGVPMARCMRDDCLGWSQYAAARQPRQQLLLVMGAPGPAGQWRLSASSAAVQGLIPYEGGAAVATRSFVIRHGRPGRAGVRTRPDVGHGGCCPTGQGQKGGGKGRGTISSPRPAAGLQRHHAGCPCRAAPLHAGSSARSGSTPTRRAAG